MAKIVQELTVDQAKAVAAWDKLTKTMTKTEKAAAKITVATKEVTKANKALERQAVRTFERSKSASQKYKDEVRALNQAVKAGTLTEKQRAQALRFVRAEMQNVGAAGRQAFGATALTRLGAIAAGYLSVTRAIQGVTSAFRAMNTVRQEAAQRQRAGEIGIGSLGQLALGDPEELRRLRSLAEQTFAEGGAADIGEAGRFVFSLESAGALEHRKLFSDLRTQSLIEQPGVMARSAKTLLQTMGAEETGGMPALVSKAFGVSAFSPSSAEQILEAAAKSGTSAGFMGMRDEPLLAATALLATAKGGAETGGTFLAQMMRTFKQKEEFEGLSLRQSVVEAGRLRETMSNKEFKEFFGRAQGQEAFEIILGDLATFDRATEAADRAQRTNLAARVIRTGEALPEIAALRRGRQETAKRELGERDLGTRRNLTDALLERGRRGARGVTERAPHPRIAEFISTAVDFGMRLSRGVSGDEAFLRNFGGALQPGPLRSEIERNLLSGDIRDAGLDPNSEMFRDLFESLGGKIDQTNQQLQQMNQQSQQPTLNSPGVKEPIGLDSTDQ